MVGESGSGKSTLARLLLGLERPDAGTVRFGAEPLGGRRRERRAFHEQVQFVYQNPYRSLNPALSVGASVAEPLENYRGLRGAALRSAVGAALESVALPAEFAARRPAELSGGQRQRVAIARAIAVRPAFIVLDEPVSALDVSVQAQILQLLVDLQAEFGTGYLFISHDLAVVRLISDRVAVMRAGRVVETGSTAEVFTAPQTDYTRELLAAIPGALQ